MFKRKGFLFSLVIPVLLYALGALNTRAAAEAGFTVRHLVTLTSESSSGKVHDYNGSRYVFLSENVLLPLTKTPES